MVEELGATDDKDCCRLAMKTILSSAPCIPPPVLGAKVSVCVCVCVCVCGWGDVRPGETAEGMESDWRGTRSKNVEETWST